MKEVTVCRRNVFVEGVDGIAHTAITVMEVIMASMYVFAIVMLRATEMSSLTVSVKVS